MGTTAKHRSISRQLTTEIQSGRHKPGARLPSEAQLVKRFKVSRPTVGRALRDLQDQGLIERRAGSGTYVCDLRDSTAAIPGSTQLGLIAPHLHGTEVFESICGELASLARVHDLGLWWGSGAVPHAGGSGMSAVEAEALCAQFIERGVAGVFFISFEFRPDHGTANERITQRLHQAGIPVVLLDRDITPYPQRSAFDVVSVDNFAGGHTLAMHLIKLGVRRFGYVTRPHTAPSVDSRIAGARAALIEHNIPVERDFVHIGDPTHEKFVRSLTSSHRPEAILCTSDHIAAQLLQTLTRMRVRVPRDIRLTGFDDIRIASLLTPPLTTMAQPCRDIAITAFHAMRERLADPTLPPRSLLLTPKLVVRESCGAYLRK